ncbi:tetratricopeptide repeat protein [candidate division KSB1 bacterium]
MMKKMENCRIIILIGLFLLIGLISSGFAQNEAKLARRGNKLYNEGKYNAAEIDYRKSLEKKSDYTKAQFNLGNAMYQQKNYEEASKVFEGLTQKSMDAVTTAKAYHNLGNSYLEQKKFKEGINAYKNSLKLNPNDVDTKYNLAYAQRMLNQQQQQQQNKDQDQNQEDKKDQEQQNQDQQQQEQQKEQQQKQEQQQNQQQKGQMSKEDAERMLEALKNDELKTIEKVNKKKTKGVQVQIEKDW